MKKRVLFYLLCFWSNGVLGQQLQKPPIDFARYTFDNGFPMSETYKMVQDKYHFLWLFSYQMLVRFDGVNYVTYRASQSNPMNLPNRQTGLACAPDGHIWLLHDHGISVFDYSKNRFESFDLGFSKGEVALCIYFNATNKTAFVGTSRGNVIVFESDKNQIKHSIKVSDGEIRSFVMLDNNTLWVGESESIIELMIPSLKFKKIVQTPKHTSALKAGVLAFYQDTKDRIWASIAYEGIWIFDTKTKLKIKTLNPTNNRSANEIYTIKEAKNEPNTYWLATGQGLFRYEDKLNVFYSYVPEPQNNRSIGTFWTSDLLEDHLGNLWVAGNGLFKYNSQNKAFTQHKLKDFWEPNMYFEEIDSNQTFIATHGKGLVLYDVQKKKTLKQISLSKLLDGNNVHDYVYTLYRNPNRPEMLLGGQIGLMSYNYKTNVAKDLSKIYGLKTGIVFDIVQDKRKQFWIATSAGLFVFDADYTFIKKLKYPAIDTDLHKNFTSTVFCDSTGHIWVGALGLYRYDELRNCFISYKKLSGLEVRSMVESPSGLYWCATDKGLVKTDITGKQYQLFDVESGFSESYIHQVLNDNSGNIWTTGAVGLNMLKPNNNFIKTYTTRDGLAQNLLVLGFCKGKFSNRFYASLLGENGFEVFEPTKINESNKQDTDLRLTEISLGDKKLNVNPERLNTVVIEADAPLLTVKFALMNFSDPASNRYAYQLEGAYGEWVDLKSQNFLTFSNLKSGKYVLNIKANDQYGTTNKQQAHLQIVVLTPYYQSWWFMGLCFIGLLSLLYGVYHYRLSQILKLQTLRNNISRDLHDEVGSSLSSISMLSASTKIALEKDPKRGLMLVDMISKNVQKILEDMDDIVWAVSPNKDSFQHIITRIQDFLNTLEETQSLNVRFVQTGHFDNISLPMLTRRNLYLIFKEAVNNAAKHARATTLRVEIKHIKNDLFLAIIDNGQGFDMTKSTSRNGLGNMRGRANEIKGLLEIDSNGKGTKIELKISL